MISFRVSKFLPDEFFNLNNRVPKNLQIILGCLSAWVPD